MSMRCMSVTSIAIIDPTKNFGEPGQYVSHTGSLDELEHLDIRAHSEKKEIRWYYRGLTAAGDEPVASQVIITEIPPGHVQPFHTHRTLHEMTLVERGCIGAIDSETLTELEIKKHLAAHTPIDGAKFLSAGMLVIEGPGTRHTIFNPSPWYARLYTIQTARMSIEKFPSDWHRDGK